jgi:hypothetical protein
MSKYKRNWTTKYSGSGQKLITWNFSRVRGCLELTFICSYVEFLHVIILRTTIFIQKCLNCFRVIVFTWKCIHSQVYRLVKLFDNAYLFYRGPDNTDVFSENFHHTSRIEEDSEAIRLARQKIKDLLLQVI